MKHKVYTIWDDKIKGYGTPFLALNKGHAMRFVQKWMENPQSDLAKYPEDFTIFEIGDYDDNEGRYSMYEKKEPMGCLIEYKRTEEQPITTQGH